MAKDEAPVKFTRPEDDPALARLVDALKKDSADGDPLYVDFRKRGAPAGAAEKEKTSAPDAPVVAELRAVEASTGKPPAFPRWMPALVLAIVGPVVVLALALMLARAKAPVVAVTPVPSAAAPALSHAAGAPATAAAEKPAATGETSASAPPPTVPAFDSGTPSAPPPPSARPRPKAREASADAGAAEPAIAPDFVQ